MRCKDLLLMTGLCFLSAVIGGTVALRTTGTDAYAKLRTAQDNKVTYSSQNNVKSSKSWVSGTKGWTQKGNYIYPVAVDTDSVGIGLSNPLYPLDVNGNINLRAKIYLNGSVSANKVLKTNGSSNPYWGIDSTGSGTITSIGPGTPGTQTGSSQLTFSANPITGTGTIALSNTAVAPGSYTFTNLTVDQQGRITAASNGPGVTLNCANDNYVVKRSGANNLVCSIIQDNGTNVGVNTAPNASYRLDVVGGALGTEAIMGEGSNGIGVEGTSTTYYGVFGNVGSTYPAVAGQNASGIAGALADNKYAVYGNQASVSGAYAGYFDGRVNVSGVLTSGTKDFLIDHPLDPVNKTLRHHCVESPENLCLYRGKVILDGEGRGLIKMPNYFVALTKANEASVNLTPVGKPFMTGCEWNSTYTEVTVYGEPNREVFYIVLADRNDPVIKKLGKPVEEDKGAGNICNKGELLYPEAYGYPKELGHDYKLQEQQVK